MVRVMSFRVIDVLFGLKNEGNDENVFGESNFERDQIGSYKEKSQKRF